MAEKSWLSRRVEALHKAAELLEGTAVPGVEDPALHHVLAELDRLGVSAAVVAEQSSDTSSEPEQAFLLRDHVVAVGANGRLSQSGVLQSSGSDLARIFGVVKGQERIVLWLHGGLVSERDAAALALDAGPLLQENTGAYPLFLAWKTGALEVLPQTIRDLVTKPKVVKALLTWALKLFGLKQLEHVPGMLGLESIGVRNASRDEPRADWEATLDAVTVDTLRSQMEQDQDLMEALEQLCRPRRGLESRGPEGLDLLSQTFVGSVTPQRRGLESIGVITAMGLAKAALSIADRVRNRKSDGRQWNGWRDTIVEEVIRETGAPHLVGAGLWERMKQNAREAYQPGHGGSLLALYLAAWLGADDQRELHLIAHSAGSFQAGHMMTRLASLLPRREHIVSSLSLLAPACDLTFCHSSIAVWQSRVKHRRLFVLSETQEDTERMVPFVYGGSLLNLVSGLLEQAPGWPILGMDRFLKSELPVSFKDALIHAPDPQGRSNSLKHGGFDDDGATRRTIMEMIGIVSRRKQDPHPSTVDDSEVSHVIASDSEGKDADSRPPPLEAGAKPKLVVRWPDDAESATYAHVGQPGSEVPFDLSGQVLERLVALNHFRLIDSDRVLFGLRGCTIDGTDEWIDFSPSVTLREAIPNHRHCLCTLGVWQRSTGLVSVFRGSTVPNWRYLEDHILVSPRCNMLPTGIYRYYVGRHGNMQGAFRLREPRVDNLRFVTHRANRGKQEISITLSDEKYITQTAQNNIHPAFNPRNGVDFSSAGCQTIMGTWNPRTGQPLGNWAEFRVCAGLQRMPATSDNGINFDYMLLTGREARIVASDLEDTALERIRYGARGEAVKELQRRLGFVGNDVDGIMGAGTTMALINWQSENGHSGDGIATEDTLRQME